jgi:hypothetical protein
MPVSDAVREYYREHIFLPSTRTHLPANFRPLEVPATGRSSVEGCAGGGKNLLEVAVVLEGGRIADVRASCGLCNPAMYAAADIVCTWARGRPVAAVLAVDVLDREALAPLFALLAGRGRPDDAREKFQYALLALRQALHVARGEPVPPAPSIAPPTDGSRSSDDADAGGG